MLKRYQDTVRGAFRAVDAVIMVAAWLGSYFGRFFLPVFEVTKGLPPFETYAALTPLIAVLWIAVFSWMRVYDSQRRLGKGDEIKLVLKAHGVALLLFIAVTYMFEDYKYSRLVMAYFAVFGALGLASVRFVIATVLRRMRTRGFNLRYVLAVGEGPVLESVVERLESHPELGAQVRGVVTQEGSPIPSMAGRPVLGHFGDVCAIIQSTKVDEVIIALPPSQHFEIDRLLDLMKNETVDLRLVPDVHRFVAIGCEVESFAGFPVVRLNDSPMFGWAALAKRSTDVVLSALALLVLAPLMLTIGLLVKLTSRGPMLYAQERMGLDGRTFRILKFRSMKTDAESATGAVWARAVDDRRTAFGTFLRKTSLDELPQFWNVLRGDMSLVGPRPERPVFVQKFRDEIPFYNVRHKVKAGITGWAQVNGWRGDTALDRRIECDLFYIRNWTYMLDLKILVLTLWKGFFNKNAY
jgi:Undecaprenyl-phosphate glucose phosphotransferase